MEKLTKEQQKALRKEEKQQWEIQLQHEQRKKIIQKIIIWVGAIFAVILCFWAIINFTGNSQSSPVQTYKTPPPITDQDMTIGPKNAKVKLIEYADFQCPACNAYYPIVKKLVSTFNGKILFVYRYYPLVNIHQHALMAAKAAYAAGLQGKFWDMHDMLFEHQKDWADNAKAENMFQSYAAKLNLDISKYSKDFVNPDNEKVIMDQENKGADIGINSTPTFFINGKHIPNPGGFDEFKIIIEQQFNRK